ncbi:MAG: hypothetical protein CVU81_01375 [Euryarchaeota archaeon HGW-Euryarchaeota-1]|nr:MAG: hypothetical protein CVU81_01375 [Euryarchaeota archaeon HGW-Euryarchaeota-1]
MEDEKTKPRDSKNLPSAPDKSKTTTPAIVMTEYDFPQLLPYVVEKDKSGAILKINFHNTLQIASIEYSDYAMEQVLRILELVGSVSKVIISKQMEFEYPSDQTAVLIDFIDAINYLKRSFTVLDPLPTYQEQPGYMALFMQFRQILENTIYSHPVRAYISINKMRRDIVYKVQYTKDEFKEMHLAFIDKHLTPALNVLEQTQMIKKIKESLPGYVGSRDIYTQIFQPLLRPSFIYTNIQLKPSEKAIEIDNYLVNNVKVSIYKINDDVNYIYSIEPQEYFLSDKEYSILDDARRIISEYKPFEKSSNVQSEMRGIFSSIILNVLLELNKKNKVSFSYEELANLRDILVRETVGFGIIEVIASDSKIQDIFINAPAGTKPIYVNHAIYGECRTNVVPTIYDVEAWVTKLKILSNRPLDESSPTLDTFLNFPPNTRVRVAATTPPLNAYGIGLAIRRHRSDPWTLPLFINNKMTNSLGAALISFIVDYSCTFLVAGTRGSGKTSMLSAMIFQVMNKHRFIIVEDTREIDVDTMRKTGYDVESLQAQSPIIKTGAEMSISSAIRVALRLGDSALIIGEVRSEEAITLYEAMRIGALANIVGGTIHGDTPYGVFDRVVNDLHVPITSFKATDIIIMTGIIKSPGGLQKLRRITRITEVRKRWTTDPVKEGCFVDLLVYNAETDELDATDALQSGDSEILKRISSNVAVWKNNWNLVWGDILLRKAWFDALAEAGKTYPEMLEADFYVNANNIFHNIYETKTKALGFVNYNEIYKDLMQWLEVKKTLKKE